MNRESIICPRCVVFNDRQSVRLWLKVRVLKAEGDQDPTMWMRHVEPEQAEQAEQSSLRQVHHSLLRRWLRWQEGERDDHTLSYADAFVKTDSESIEATVACMGEERLPKRMVFWE